MREAIGIVRKKSRGSLLVWGSGRGPGVGKFFSSQAACCCAWVCWRETADDGRVEFDSSIKLAKGCGVRHVCMFGSRDAFPIDIPTKRPMASYVQDVHVGEQSVKEQMDRARRQSGIVRGRCGGAAVPQLRDGVRVVAEASGLLHSMWYGTSTYGLCMTVRVAAGSC